MVKSSDILRINHFADEIRYLALFSRHFDCFDLNYIIFCKERIRTGKVPTSDALTHIYFTVILL